MKINNIRTDWFVTNQGVRPGDNLSPTLFNIYINDIALGLKKLGVTIGNLHVCILLYADDIVLISKNCYGVSEEVIAYNLFTYTITIFPDVYLGHTLLKSVSEEH